MLTTASKYRPTQNSAYWYIDLSGKPNGTMWTNDIFDFMMYEIGNTFKNKEDITTDEMAIMPARIMCEYAKGEEEC